MGEVPQTFDELFEFYHNQVKVYYSAVQAENELPMEVLFELNAALDHLSRHYIYGETEREVSEKAYSHFKRACLDVFKITVRETLDKYRQLIRIDISLIDNGVFEKSVRQLISEIKKGALEARRLEGRSQDGVDHGVPAFNLWVPVYEKCLQFEQDYYLNNSVDWAKRKGRWLSIKTIVVTLFLSAILGAIIRPFFDDLMQLVIQR